MWLEWLAAAAVLIGFLALLPRLLRRPKAASRKLGGSGVMIGLGMVFAMIFDPKAVVASEQMQKRNEIGDSEEGESGEGL
jgi:hypothetical protein